MFGDPDKKRKQRANERRNVVKEMAKRHKDVSEKLEIQRQQENPNIEGQRAKIDDEKKTYPIKMEFYEPENVAIFALVSKEIQIQRIKKTGNNRKFSCI
jgi:hypothetical protein